MSVWRVPGFARLSSAAFFAETAEWILLVALPLYVYQITGSAGSLAVGMVVGTLPTVLLSPAAGVYADRFDRRLILGAVCLGQVVVALPLFFVHSGGQLAFVYLTLGGQACLASFFEPARNAFLPELVGVGHVTAANGLMAVVSSVTRLTGSALGGVLLGFGGLAQVVWIYQALLALACVSLLRRFPVRRRTRSVTAPESMLRSWLDGVDEIRRDRRLRVTVWSMVLVSLAQGMFVVLFVVFVTGVLRGTEAELGLLRGVQAIGGLAGGALLTTVARRVAPAKLLAWGTLVFGVTVGVIWNTAYLTTAFSVYLGLFIVVGAPGVFANAGMLSMLQTSGSPERTGRVLSTGFAAITACNAVGSLVAGVLAAHWGAAALLNGQAVLILASGTVALYGLVLRPGKADLAVAGR